MAAERLVSAKELAELLGVSRAWVDASARAEKLPAYRVGGVWRFDLAQVARWLDAHGNQVTQSPVSGGRAALPTQNSARDEPPAWRIDLANTVPAQEVADELDVPIDAVKRWIRSGLLPGTHAGKTWSVDATALMSWRQILRSHQHLAASPRGKVRTESIGDAIKSALLRRRSGGLTRTVRSVERSGGRVPTWAEVMRQPQGRQRGRSAT